jgi:DNA primase
MITDTRTKHTRRYRGVSVTRVIDAAKGGVAVERLAAELTTLKGANEARELTGRCPLPDHEDRTPSFTVNPEKGVFYCHGCGAGGDVIDLAQAAWSIDRPDVAAAELLLYFGLEVPKRLPAWFRKRERQKPIRDGLSCGR